MEKSIPASVVAEIRAGLTPTRMPNVADASEEDLAALANLDGVFDHPYPDGRNSGNYDGS